MKKLLLPLVCSILLYGCGDVEMNKATDLSKVDNFNGELHWDYLRQDNSPQVMSFGDGVFVSCVEGQAFVATTKGQGLSILPIQDSGKYIQCGSGVKNMMYRIGHEDKLDKITGLALCVGGYSFVHIKSAAYKGGLIQLFNEDGKAKFCIPKNLDIYKDGVIPIIHPELALKATAIDKILKNSQIDPEKKIY